MSNDRFFDLFILRLKYGSHPESPTSSLLDRRRIMIVKKNRSFVFVIDISPLALEKYFPQIFISLS